MHSGLLQEFRNRYGKDAERVFFCPGRVNLIGEHIDYNGGKVMPCAIDRGTTLAIARNTEMKINFQCLNFPEKASLKLQNSYTRSGKSWFNYPLGAINQLLNDGAGLSGMDLLFQSDLPIGAGLSSSASIIVLTSFAMNELFGLSLPRLQLALLAKKVENEFIGVNCGIMDQVAIAMGKKGHAILLDCESLDMDFLPFQSDEYALVVINTKKERLLVDSKYNERFAECAEALSLLKKELPIHSLCDLNYAAFETHRHLINDPVLEKRAKHVISENDRVRQAAIYLRDNDFKRFGDLMDHSHDSLKEDYEVSCEELDAIFDFSMGFLDCIGARMTGAGFGGCAIALVRQESLGEFEDQLNVYYHNLFGFNPELFSVRASDAVAELL